MSSRAAEVSALYESALNPRLASLEAGRRELKHYIVKSVVLVGVPFLLFFFASSVVPAGLGMVADIVSFALIFVAIVVAGIRYLVPGYTAFMNYKARYKREVVSEIFKVIVPTASYEPFQGIAETVFDEPGIFKTLGGFSSDDRVRGRIGDTPADHFALAETIVNELDLNTRDFKGFDDSLLRQPNAPPDPLKEKLTTGTLEASDVWRLASDAVGIDEGEAAAARPPDSTIDVTHAFDGTRINYGFSFGFLFAFAVSIAALIVSLSAARTVARDNGISQLEPLVRQLPPIPRVDDLVAPYAMVWLPASLIVGALFALYWVFRVRRVAIEREAILIWRGLRPIPRRYRRPPYGRVVRIDKAVYVGKVGGLSPINPSASPMLPSEDEAKWIAAEMRRGLQQTLR